jgi:hypothetical protein
MVDGDDLPDWDFESIYGREALLARLTARMTAVERAFAVQHARLRQLTDAMDARTRASDPP